MFLKKIKLSCFVLLPMLRRHLPLVLSTKPTFCTLVYLLTFVFSSFCHMFILMKKFWHVTLFYQKASWTCVHLLQTPTPTTISFIACRWNVHPKGRPITMLGVNSPTNFDKLYRRRRRIFFTYFIGKLLENRFLTIAQSLQLHKISILGH